MEIKNWKMNFMEHQGLECSVPCSMYSVLLDYGKMEDPFWGLNEAKCRELSREDCEFFTEFSVSADDMEKEHIELKFYGLDTLCDIYLNGKLIASTNNMHRTYCFDVKKYVKAGENEIKIYISSPIEYVEDMLSRHKIWSSEEAVPGISFIRKSYCMFGWDWGPQLPDMGIFRPVELLCYDGALLENVLIRQKHKNGNVTLDLDIETNHCSCGYTYEATFDGKTYEFDSNKGKINVENPKLWYPRGYGEQNLYDLKIILKKDGEVRDTLVKTIGLRTLTVSTKEDKYGSEFCFVCNGIKMFAMGADYIPEDSILAHRNADTTESIIKACVDANFNSIRVWGGGYYPDDSFFDLCDRYGLVVWQDFCVACANIWLTEDLEANFKAEAIDNIKRLRHHASLGLLCGNNEMELCQVEWGKEYSQLVLMDYLRLYEHVLPELCYKYAPDVFYWPASPSSHGGFDNPNDENRGDVHYWDVWHGNKPFEDYRNYFFRFCSEFGFESFPSMKTIRTFAEEKDLNPFSPVMENHQKCLTGNTKILNYLGANYLYATSFDALVYASQLLQADAVGYGVEHFRAHRGRCMGAIYWQINDCWPVASWASIDYFGRRKALHYAAKRFFAPVLLSLHEEGYKVRINVSNETLDKFEGTVRWQIKDTDFGVIYQQDMDATVDCLSAEFVKTFDAEKYITDASKQYMVCTLLDITGSEIASKTLLFTKPKKFDFKAPVLKASVKADGKKAEISITADSFAKGVEIDFADFDLVLSDNYFDITSKDGVTVYAETDKSADEILKSITLKSVYDIR